MPQPRVTEARVLALRRAGWPFAKIATYSGLDGPVEAYAAFLRAVNRFPTERGELLGEEIRRLDRLADAITAIHPADSERLLDMVDKFREHLAHGRTSPRTSANGLEHGG